MKKGSEAIKVNGHIPPNRAGCGYTQHKAGARKDRRQYKMARIFRLKHIVPVVFLLAIACNLKPEEVEGEYYSQELGDIYTLTLNKDIFVQVLICNGDTFINTGQYSVYDVIQLYSWKSRDELLNKKKGGCNGCELIYKRGKLMFYSDPDANPIEVFEKK